MKLAANIVSIVFHPLLMITYGIILALTGTYLAIYPTAMRLIIAGGVFFATALIPGLFILLLVKTGSAKNMELTDKNERLIPYLIMITSNVACLFFLYKMMMPFWMLFMFAGATASLIAAMCINFFWKISAHLLGIGGVLGAIMGLCQLQMKNPYLLFMGCIIAAGALGASRIYLGRHTPGQVYAGFAMGFGFTYIASLMSYIYLFI